MSKTNMISFVGGSVRIWSAQRASRQLRRLSIEKRTLSWFKDTAFDHIAKIRELVAILENHGAYVRMLKAKRVGYVVYEDEFQIVAEPFSDLNC
jgi:hypothetical protein